MCPDAPSIWEQKCCRFGDDVRKRCGTRPPTMRARLRYGSHASLQPGVRRRPVPQQYSHQWLRGISTSSTFGSKPRVCAAARYGCGVPGSTRRVGDLRGVPTGGSPTAPAFVRGVLALRRQRTQPRPGPPAARPSRTAVEELRRTTSKCPPSSVLACDKVEAVRAGRQQLEASASLSVSIAWAPLAQAPAVTRRPGHPCRTRPIRGPRHARRVQQLGDGGAGLRCRVVGTRAAHSVRQRPARRPRCPRRRRDAEVQLLLAQSMRLRAAWL